MTMSNKCRLFDATLYVDVVFFLFFVGSNEKTPLGFYKGTIDDKTSFCGTL